METICLEIIMPGLWKYIEGKLLLPCDNSVPSMKIHDPQIMAV